jgi:SAM-dependent MidA family methyltransferase
MKANDAREDAETGAELSALGSASPHAAPLTPHSPLHALIAERIRGDGGWWPFDRFMVAALYTPGLGYYARGAGIFGATASEGDFTTAPEMCPLFGAALAPAIGQALAATGTDELWEFGAGSGALAAQLLQALDARGEQKVARYTIVDLSGGLRAAQRERLAPFGDRVRWADAWPERMTGVVIGNEVLDAMPVQLLHFDGQRWFERGVALTAAGALAFADRPTALRPPVNAGFAPATTTELHAQAEAFVRTLAERLERGAAFFIDYGFPDAEYYLPERRDGTLMCHRAQRADANPLIDVGAKDITAHVNFSGLALAAQDAGFEVLGYTSQAHFLINGGLLPLADAARARGEWPALAAAQKLIAEHEMGELFKVLGLVKGVSAFDSLGFARGDRSHRL